MKLELKKLKDLEIGDKFYPASQHGKKSQTFFIVRGKCEFNIQYGSFTRKCFNQDFNSIENKSCRMEVMKVNH